MPQSFLRHRFFCPHGSPAAPDVFRTAPACACHLPFLPRRAFALPFDERLFLSLRAFGCRTFACVKRPAARLFARAARRGEAEKFSHERLCPQRAARRFGARLVFRKSVLPGYANTYPFFSATSNRTFFLRHATALFIRDKQSRILSAGIRNAQPLFLRRSKREKLLRLLIYTQFANDGLLRANRIVEATKSQRSDILRPTAPPKRRNSAPEILRYTILSDRD